MDVRKLALVLLLVVTIFLVFSVAAQKAYTSRRAQVEEMTPEQKAELAEHWEEFNELPRKKREQVCRLHDKLKAQPDSESLELTMSRYHDWLETLPWYAKAELRALPTEERIERIREIRDEQTVRNLSKEDHGVVLAWLNRRLGEEGAKLAEELRDPNLEPRRRQDKIGEFMGKMGKTFSRRNEEERDKALAELRAALSPRVREIMEKKSTREQGRIVIGWIFGSFGPSSRGWPPGGGPGRTVDDSELVRFYESLSPEEKQRLQGIRDEARLQKLRELYQQRRMRGPNGRPGWRRGRDFGGPPEHRGRRGGPGRNEGRPFSGPPGGDGPHPGGGPPPGEGLPPGGPLRGDGPSPAPPPPEQP